MIESYLIKHPYTAEELSYLANSKTKFVYAPIEKGEFLITKFKQIVTNTMLDDDRLWVSAKPTSDIFTFNAAVGPDFSIEVGLLHEIAHAIQLKKKNYSRLKHNSMFVKPKSSITRAFGQEFYEPISAEPTICEAETVAIQLHLLEMLNYEVDHAMYIDDWVNTLCCGAMADDNSHSHKNRKAMIAHFITGFYMAWENKQYLMKKRFDNFLDYQQK